MSVKRAKPANAKGRVFLKSRIKKINAILSKLEIEFEKAIRGVIAKGEQSSHDLRKTFDEMLEWLKNGQIYAFANETKETLVAEITKLKTETLAKVKEIETVAGRGLFQEVRDRLSALLVRVQGSSLLEIVRTRAIKSKEQLLQVLDVPKQEQIHSVERRIDRLEKKVQTLLKKAA